LTSRAKKKKTLSDLIKIWWMQPRRYAPLLSILESLEAWQFMGGNMEYVNPSHVRIYLS